MTTSHQTTTTAMPQPMATPAEHNRGAVDERLRRAVLEKRQADIDAWNRQIDQLQNGLDQLGDEARKEADKRLDQLVQAREKGVEQLRRLGEATESNWESLLEQTDRSFQHLADRFHALVQNNS